MLSQIFLSSLDHRHTKVESNDYGLLALARGELYRFNEERIPLIVSTDSRHHFVTEYSYPFVKMLLESYKSVIVG